MNSLSRARKASLGMTAVLGVAIAAGAGFAFFNAHAAPATAVRPETAAPPAEARPATAQAAPASNSLTGTVLETFGASSYTYLRLATDSGEIWSAVPTSSVTVGSKVTVENASKMTAFKSSTLNRTFDVIYFGTLASGPKPARISPADALAAADDEQSLPPGHPDVSGSPLADVGNSGALPPGHPSVDGAAAGVSPHGSSPSSAGSALPELAVPPARGSNARVIAQLSAERAQLAGKTVRVRGQVTKVTAGVQGHTFFHLRDGKPGDTPASDLVVTSDSTPERGQVATFEGTVRTDVDLGIGYKYPILLENAALVAE